MTLTLRAVALNDQPLTQPITAHFDQHGGTIGRADHNTLALPDPERHISREQAEITQAGAGYVIRNVGSSNPIVVRNRPLVHGESAPLGHNDQVRIGRYLLEVTDDEAATDSEFDTDMGGITTIDNGAVPRAAISGVAPGREPVTPLSPNNPFADLLSPATPARLPKDFDPFAPLAAQKAPAQPAVASASAGAFGDLIPSPAPSSIDELFGLQGGTAGDPLADFLADVQPASPQGPAVGTASNDPLVLFGAPAKLAPPPEVLPDRTPELRAVFIPPQPATPAAAKPSPVAAIAPVPAPAPQPSAAPWDGQDSALWNAFCEGAGVKAQLGPGASPEAMRTAGMLLRSAVDGMLQLIAVRSATRHELHAQVTMIQARNNNPLKFSPDAQAALEQLLQPPLRGFLPGPTAVAEAMDDLVGHAIGTMAGTRSALEGVLARFAPQALEAKLTSRSVVDSLLPMARRARLWELYLQHHEAIRDEAQEDFHALFGKAFLAAYEQQLERLRQEKAASAQRGQ